VILGDIVAPSAKVVGRHPALAAGVQIGPQPPVVIVPGAVFDFWTPRLAEDIVGSSIQGAHPMPVAARAIIAGRAAKRIDPPLAIRTRWRCAGAAGRRR